MAQNTSHAVMAQRHEVPDSLDYFPTPPWATRALCEQLLRLQEFGGWEITSLTSAWDPACGEGHMVRPLAEWFHRIEASDIHDYGRGYRTSDFLGDGLFPPWRPSEPVDWIITNPPFNLGEQFVHLALRLARIGVAMLVRTAFLETLGRCERLFLPCPPALILQFAERVPMLKGRLDPNGDTATAYCWIVWRAGEPRDLHPAHAPFLWIPPCRKRLEKPEDYR